MKLGDRVRLTNSFARENQKFCDKYPLDLVIGTISVIRNDQSNPYEGITYKVDWDITDLYFGCNWFHDDELVVLK